MTLQALCYSIFFWQVNEFQGGGIALGLSCTHMHADPTCATLFYKSWIDTHRTKAVAHLPVYSSYTTRRRSDLNNKTGSVAYYAAKSAARATTPSEKMATATLKFSHAVIKRCLMETTENCANATPFDLLAALFWTRVVRLKALRYHCSHSLSICTDGRRVLREDGKALPLGYYGNALYFSLLTLEKFDGYDLGHVVGEIHRHVKSIDEEEIRSSIEWLESRAGVGRKYGPPFRMYGPELTCVSMEHMVGPFGPNGPDSGPLMYEAGFGEEAEPIHVSYHVRNVEGEGLIMVMPSPEGGLARAVTVTLPEKELAELCEDQAILGLEPTMLLSGSLRC